MFRRIKNRKLYSSTDSVPVRPPVLERLEPRILLSGDGLLNIAPPDPLQDAPQVVQYAELLETEEQLPTTGPEIHVQLVSSDQPERDLYQPILTLCADGDDTDTNLNSADSHEPVGDLDLADIAPAQTSDDLAALPDDSDVRIDGQVTVAEAVSIIAAEPTTDNSAVPAVEDGSMPTQISDVDLSIEICYIH